MKYVHSFSNKNKIVFDNKLNINDIKNFRKYSFKLIFIHNKEVLLFNNKSFCVPYSKLISLKNKLTNPILLGKINSTIFLGFIVKNKLLNSISKIIKNTPVKIRDSISLIDIKIVPYITTLYSLSVWINKNKYCSNCGKKNTLIEFAQSIQCNNKSCNIRIFPRIDPAVIMLIYYKNKILLARNKNWRKNLYSCLAGFCEISESLEETVKRETYEEVGLKIKNIEYLFSQFWPFPNNLMIAFKAEAIKQKININKNEIENAIWVTKKDLLKMEKDRNILLPNKHAIAYSLIEEWKKLNLSEF